MLCQIILPSTETSTLSTFPQSFHDLRETVKSKLNLTSPSSTLTLKYRDSDDELVVLNNEEDLQTAILTLKSEEMTTLKVNVNYQEENSNLNLKKNSSDGTSLERSRAELSLRNISSAPFSDNLDGKTNLQVKMSSFDPLGTKVNKPANKNIKGLFSGLTGRLKSQEEQNFDISKSTPLFGAVNRRNEPICSECQEQIQGVKYMCLDCSKYRCCEACEAKVEHAHPLLKVRDSMNQSANIETKYRYSYSSMFGTPEKRENRGQRLSFSKASGEKKTVYAGKVFLDNTRDQVIKTCPYQEEKVVVVVKNNGSETWPKNVKLSCVNGFYRNKEESLFSLEKGEKQNVTLYLRAPCKADKYLSQWRLTYTEEGKSKSFGESLFIELHVEENNTISKQKSLPCEEKVSTNLVRRAKTLTEAFLKRNEEQGKSQRENNDKRAEVAEWLNEVFPGDLKEKIEFLDSCGYKGNEEDMSRIVGLYLQSLIKVRTDGKEKAQKDFMKGEEICA